MKKATEKQVGYLFVLLAKRGYPTKYMSAKFRALGATCRERSGEVGDWLRSLDIARASKLISQLQ